MAQLTIPDETLERFRRHAAALHVPAEQLATVVLEQAAWVTQGAPPPPDRKLSHEEWKALFDEFVAEARSRAGRYPPGFQVDDSRESIYQGCGE